MPIIYNVTVNPTKEENRFLITWHNVSASTMDFFDISPAEIFTGDIRTLFRQPRQQLDVGQKLFRFLDGDARHLQRALNEAHQAGTLLELHLFACNRVAEWPFELLAQESSFLLLRHLHLVRRVSDWGAEKEMLPQNRQLKMLFMACAALDVKPELEFEREEEAIFKITEKLAIQMDVEDSGSLKGLKERLEQEKYDVVHLSGHAGIDDSGSPYFVMEDEIGNKIEVTPDELWHKALIENQPRLLFLSGCHTAEIPNNDPALSFAHILTGKYGIPAVLGWDRSVSDEQAICAEEMLYHELSRGKSILDAVQRSRHDLAQKFQVNEMLAWPLLRLFSNGTPLNAIVTEEQKLKPQPRKLVHGYLKKSRVKILTEGFVGRRRQLQQSIRALKQDDKIGVIFLGAGGLGKSCLAGKLSERFTDHTFIIIHGKFDNQSLGAALKDAFVLARDENAGQILGDQNKLTEKLKTLCAVSFKEKNYLLLLDDFEQNLEAADKGQPGRLMLGAAELLKTLLHYLPYSGNMTQLIITSRYDFSLTEMDRDLIGENLEKVWLTSFHESEQRKKTQSLKHIFNYKDKDPSRMTQLINAGLGNPRLMDCMDLLAKRMASVNVPQLQEAVKSEWETFINDHMIPGLLQRGGTQLEFLLRRLSIFRRPVLKDGIRIMAEKAGLDKWEKLVENGMGLSLIEYDQVHQAYCLTPLLREEFLAKLEDIPACHAAACEYYKKKCEALDFIDPILAEEWIYHALGCGQEKTASEQGGRLVKYLRENLAFHESLRVGEWILAEKTQELASEYDAILLNETASTLKTMGDYDKAAKSHKQALDIDRSIFGELHHTVARDLNNLGAALRVKHGPREALKYFEQALHIVGGEGFADKHPDIAGNLFNNLGTVWNGLGDYNKAGEYYKQALHAWEKIYGEGHPHIAVLMNNLGDTCRRLGNHREAAGYFKKALAIDQAVYGKMHFEVATDLNNLGAVSSDLQDHNRAIDYYSKALTIWRQIYGPTHANIAVTLSNMAETYLALGQKEPAKEYFEQAYAIFKEIFGADNENTKLIRLRIDALG
ncbi:MAG TPA: tetratricopeptide repeat protein [Candidatus Deferrimicrobium sp.]|nr:tetratricopeptide repeat protein [Candidatus Deferrimicrobium sp.]